MSDNSNIDEFLELGDDFDDFDPFNSSDEDSENSSKESADGSDAAEKANEKTNTAIEKDAAPASQAVQFPKPQSSQTKAEKVAENPMLAAADAAEEQEVKLNAASLLSLPPVFTYASVNEDITEDLTFEELRIDKSADFPELDDPKKIEWTVEYGKIIKKVAKPGETNIAKMKSEIEFSKEFLDSLKKSKDKAIRCKIKPRVIAQTKGVKPMATYKGIYTSQEEAQDTDKLIRLFPSSNGIMFEQRINEMGVFTTPAKNIAEISEVSAGFKPALPRIPFSVMSQVIAFFRHYIEDENELEALVHIFWDKELAEFKIVVPQQYVSRARIKSEIRLEDALDESRYIHYADIHSHNTMKAEFSFVDDEDERATRLYIVIGRLQNYFPEISCRISNGGTFWNVKPNVVIEGLNTDFPAHWTEYVFNEPIIDAEAVKELMQNAI